MTKFDKNKDGKLTQDEVPPPMWEGLTRAGVVKDGAVTKEGLEVALKKMREHFHPGAPAAKPQGGPDGGPHARWPGGPNRPNMPGGTFAGGGRLIVAPTVDQMWEHLTKLGAVQNGVVTKESLAAAIKKRQAERQKQQPPAK